MNPAQRKRDYWPLLFVSLLALASSVVYLPTLSAGFVHWDDGIEIYANPHLGPVTWERLKWMFTDIQYLWRYQPLTWLGWCLTHQVWGLEPSAYHFGNWALHAANSVLLFLCLVRLFGLVLPVGDQRRLRIYLAAFAAALFWALHPLRVEPVAWATGRLYLQALFFLLLSLSFYLRARFPLGTRTAFNSDYWIALAFLGFSLLSYPIAVGYAPALLALEGYFLAKSGRNRKGSWSDSFKHAVPLWMVTALIFSVSLLARFFVGKDFEPPAGIESFTLADRAVQAAYVWAHFVWKPFWPANISPVYTALWELHPAAPRFVASYGLLVLITAAALLLRKRYPGFLALWAAHLLILFPHLGLTERPHFPTDRSSYLQGIIIAIVIAAPILFARLFKPAFAVLCGAALVLASMSAVQTAVWHDSRAFFSHILESIGEHPLRADIYARVGVVHGEQGDLQNAVASFERAIAIQPTFVDAHAHLARTHFLHRDYAKARDTYSRAVELAPGRGDLRNALGDVFFAQRDYKRAEQEYREAIRLNRADASAFSNLGITYAAQKRPLEAEKAFERAHELDPKNPQHLLNLSTLMRQQGRPDDAARFKQMADRLTAPEPHDHDAGHAH